MMGHVCTRAMTTFRINHSNKSRALVIGGSLGGLFAGHLLRRIGWNVDIFERSAHDLDSRGGGIVLQPEVLEVLRQAGLDIRSGDLGVRSIHRTLIRPDSSIQSKHFAPQTQTSWSLLYTTLKAAFGDAHYHQAKALVRIDQDAAAGTVTAHFEDGTCATGELLIGADGGSSAVRQQFWPNMRPSYAGYLAWRGLLHEGTMPRHARAMLHGDFGFANNTGSHILGYLVPGEHNDVRPGHRLYNWVWYRIADERMLEQIMIDRNGHQRDYAIPAGLLADQWATHLRREAKGLLPLPFREVIEATVQPFVQAIRDLACDHLVSGRVAIIGDAAAIPRPHTAASTSKAAANALALVEALQAARGEVPLALAQWEPSQVALGKYLRQQGSQTGDYLLFNKTPMTKIG